MTKAPQALKEAEVIAALLGQLQVRVEHAA